MTRPIGVIGAGTIGRALTAAWRQAGLSVRLGARRPDGSSTVPIEDAVHEVDVIVLAVPVQALDDLIPRIGSAAAGRVVICPGNLVRLEAERRFVTDLPTGTTVGTAIQARLPQSHVVRAFSHIASELLVSRARPADAAVRWAVAIAADQPAALAAAAHLVDLAGFDAFSLGDLAASAPLDPGGALWSSLLTTGDIRARLSPPAASAGLATR